MADRIVRIDRLTVRAPGLNPAQATAWGRAVAEAVASRVAADLAPADAGRVVADRVVVRLDAPADGSAALDPGDVGRAVGDSVMSRVHGRNPGRARGGAA